MAVEGGSSAKKLRNSNKPKFDGKHTPEKKRKRTGDAFAGVQVPAEHHPSAAPPAPPATAEAEEAAGGNPASKKQRRHRRGEEQQQQSLDPEEAARRQRQRELRALAMKLRTEGKEYVPPRKGSQPRASEGGKRHQQEGSGKGGEGRKGRHYLGDKTPGWRPFSSVEVIVLPIFWNNNKEEKTAVLAASERARDILASAGLSVDMDASNKYTPGQKMKYWETMGVRVRVELGPRDVANGNCVVALSTKAPGEVAIKNVVNMRHKMLDAVRAALEKTKSGVQEKEEEKQQEDYKGVAEGSDGEDEGQQQQPKRGRAERQKGNGGAGRKRAATTATDGDEEEEEGAGVRTSEGEEDGEEEDVVAAAVAAVKSRQGGVLQRTSNAEARKLKQQRERERDKGTGKAQAPRGSTGDEEEDAAVAATIPSAANKSAKQSAAATPAPRADKAPYSADALEDDFADIVEFDAEEDKLTLNKKERLKKATKQAKAKRKAERRAGMGGSEDGGEEAVGEEREGPSWAKVGAKQSAAADKKHKVVTF